MAANVLDTILLFGDSITEEGWQPQGFVQRLAYIYGRKLDVINRGLSGYNTEWAIPVFEQIISTQSERSHVPKIALLTLWFGANDAAIPPSPLHVPLPKYSANLMHLVQMLKSPSSEYYSPKTRILLITPPPIHRNKWAAFLGSLVPPQPPCQTFDITKTYADAVRDVGKSEGVPVLDVWTAIFEAAGRDEEGLEKFLVDGLHLNTAGYTIVFDLLVDTIQKEFPELHHDKLAAVFPPWAEINFQDPRSSLTANRIKL